MKNPLVGAANTTNGLRIEQNEHTVPRGTNALNLRVEHEDKIGRRGAAGLLKICLKL